MSNETKNLEIPVAENERNKAVGKSSLIKRIL
ncbi:hypothetical protein VN96_2557 [Lactococcus cremoris]|nr:hypothetical protein VN96_2557 [Lactococcus cremoris]